MPPARQLFLQIYTNQGNLPEAGRCLDSASVYIDRSDEKNRWHDYYFALSRYHSASGNAELTVAYMDSALTIQKKHDEAFNLRKLYRAEQHAAYEKLEREKLMRENYRRFLVAAVAFIVVVLVLSGFLLYNYRKKRAAHRELVERIQRWSQTHDVPVEVAVGTGSKTVPLSVEEKVVNEPDTEQIRCENPGEQTSREEHEIFEREIFRQFEQFNDAEKLYLKGDITLDIVSEMMNVNRVYLSQAVNRCANKSFINYMNELRIKEAIHILSNNKEGFSLEGIAFVTGFNDRKTFYRVFKKVTGLSPSEFRGNLHKK